MSNETHLVTSPAADTDTDAPDIAAIPVFHVGVEGLSIQVEHKPQEIPLDDPRSAFKFFPLEKPFVVTTHVANTIPHLVILACLHQLTHFAERHDGLDYLQSFKVEGSPEPLWFIEDGDGGAITALFPSDY